MRYDVTVFGNHHSTAALIASLIADGLKPDLVVTLSEEARAKVSIASGASDLADWCRAEGIQVHACKGYRLISEADRAFFAETQFGIGVCTDWQHLLPEHVLDAFEQGVFGFHGSLMPFPNGRGRSPFNWSIRLGGRSIFHNCFKYTPAADDGLVFNTTEIPIGPEDHVADLQFKALMDSRITIRRLLRAHSGGVIPLSPQPTGASVWLPKLTPEDSRLQFAAQGIDAMLDLIRASSRPFAGAFAETEAGDLVRIWRARHYDGPLDPDWSDATPGTVLVTALGCALIACRDGLLMATELSVPADSLSDAGFR